MLQDPEDQDSSIIDTIRNITLNSTGHTTVISTDLLNSMLNDYIRALSYLSGILSNATAISYHTAEEKTGVLVSVIVGGALVFLVIGIITDSLMAYAIVRFRNLWSPQNFFLAAWLIPDVIKQFIKMYFVATNNSTSFVGNTVGCLHFSVTTACGIAMMAILVDWYLVNYFPGRLEAFRRRWKTVMVVTVVVPLLIYADDVLCQVLNDELSRFATAGVMGVMVLCSVVSLTGQVLVLFGGASKVYQDNYMLVATALFAVPFAIRWTIYFTYIRLFEDYHCFETMLFAFQYCSLLRNAIILANNRPLYKAVKNSFRCRAEDNHSVEAGVAPMEFANPTYVIHLDSENKGMAR